MKQGEIWLMNLDPAVGAEIKKMRPVVIVNDDALGKLPLKIIVPITEWKNHYKEAKWMVKIEPDKMNGLIKTSSIDCFQVRSVSNLRFVKKIGNIPIQLLNKIQIGLAKVLSISSGF